MDKPMRLILIRHGDDPPDDRVATFASLRGWELDFRRPFRGDELGELDASVAGVVVYGGPFVVDQIHDHPFLLDEHRMIEGCLDRETPLLGICQGAQSLAHVLGAQVGPPASGQSEFGYYEVSPTEAGREFLPEPVFFTQSHFHEFALPSGGVRLAYSDAFPNQAFRYGKCAYGVQFHPEVTIEGFRRWQDAPWARYHLPGAQSREKQTELMYLHDAAQARWFMSFLDGLFPA